MDFYLYYMMQPEIKKPLDILRKNALIFMYERQKLPYETICNYIFDL